MVAYYALILFSGIIIASYFFNILSKKIHVPSVILLIFFGILLQLIFSLFSYSLSLNYLKTPLHFLGIVGLIFIVLEATLDLKITRHKFPLIINSFILALGSIVLVMLPITYMFIYFYEMDFYPAIIYSVPFSLMSSAIIIPSVSTLSNKFSKEFMIYESTFSDILGIMIYYYLIHSYQVGDIVNVTLDISVSLFITIVMSVSFSFFLLWLFKNFKDEYMLFLIFSILILIYVLGKLMSLSSLLIIFCFGILINNLSFFHDLTKLKALKPRKGLDETISLLKKFTDQFSFVIRSLFFVVFGLFINIKNILSVHILTITFLIVILIYTSRFIFIKILLKNKSNIILTTASRGLVSVLLFYAIPPNLKNDSIPEAILILLIIITSLIMSYGIYREKIREKLI
jgi:Kef-type K+ transport system membrane component KefB